MIKSVSPANAEVSSIKPWGAPITSDGALSQYKSTDWGRWQIPQELFSCHKIGLFYGTKSTFRCRLKYHFEN